MPASPFQNVDQLFRHEYGRIVAMLTSKYSPDKIEYIEDAVQEALLKAMKSWPSAGKQPDNPTGWLYRVANNHLLDMLRRESRSVEYAPGPEENGLAGAPDYTDLDEEIGDEQLKMIFACCHPALDLKDQLMLSLRLLGGLTVKEIARALFKKPEAIKRALTRAKKKFRKEVGHLNVPSGEGLRPRIAAVLQVLYLMFNEGYKATSGEQLVKKDICEEAIRLGLILYGNQSTNTSELRALLALMSFHISRFDARIDEEGDLVILENQDRSYWDEVYINFGIRFLNESIEGVAWTEYHLLAGIAAQYATSPSFEEIDWETILSLYNHLIRVNGSHAVLLNRSVVLGKVEGPEKALEELDKLAENELLLGDYMYYTIRADLESQLGRDEEAIRLLEKGTGLAANQIEKRHMEKKLERLKEKAIAGPGK